VSDGFYVSMCGAVARSEQLDAVADNLANAQTPGFKAARPAFEAFLAPSGAQDKAYPAAVGTGFDLRPGPAQHTGNPLDVLPDDGAFLAVRLPDGTPAYTRDGRLTVDAEGRLVSGGRPVLDEAARPIAVPLDAPVRIDAHGTVWAGEQQVAELARVRLSGPIDRAGASTFVTGRGGIALPADVQVRVGELELGNSSALEATVALVSAQRSYDASMQALQTYRQLDQKATEVGRVR
jgi:flagellar basal-body rod protein FlgF